LQQKLALLTYLRTLVTKCGVDRYCDSQYCTLCRNHLCFVDIQWIHVQLASVDMDMDLKFHIHGKPASKATAFGGPWSGAKERPFNVIRGD